MANRRPPGIPTGGQFAAQTHDEVDISLELPSRGSVVTDLEPTDNELVEIYLAEHGYGSAEEWAADSDYVQDVDGDWTDEHGNTADPRDSLLTAIDASGFEPPQSSVVLARRLSELRNKPEPAVLPPAEAALLGMQDAIRGKFPDAKTVHFTDGEHPDITSIEMTDGSVVDIDWESEHSEWLDEDGYEAGNEIQSLISFYGNSAREYASIDVRTGIPTRA